MIQRLQTVWLFLASIFAFMTFKFPFYSGNVVSKENQMELKKFIASFDVLTLLITAVLGVGCFVTIFIYKNRKLQARLTITMLILSVLNLVVYFSRLGKFVNGDLSFAAIFALAIPIFLFLAARGIWKDEKLVKSLDRLR
jgi:predicted membrane-bound mannosyltransferase